MEIKNWAVVLLALAIAFHGGVSLLRPAPAHATVGVVSALQDIERSIKTVGLVLRNMR